MNEQPASDVLTILPLTAARWADFEALFGAHGAYGGCWCMWWRIPRGEFSRNGGEGNRLAFKALVDAGQITGVLGYRGGQAVAWCSLAPREDYAALERSRALKRLDGQPVWSLVCFYIARAWRRKGLAKAVLAGALAYARQNGAKMVEAYPVDAPGNLPPVSSFMGSPGLFRAAGFVEAARPSPRRLMMRYTFEEPSSPGD